MMFREIRRQAHIKTFRSPNSCVSQSSSRLALSSRRSPKLDLDVDLYTDGFVVVKRNGADAADSLQILKANSF
ncbi:hypothetical protein BaRGS_00038538 [Batillaria attramentaria]|uniref:Uncharacterized protein n=1 Tax=Batillaria attramentaria TaxID=370345 RepID=A0ABD0J1R8_9CAEN